MFLLLLSCSVKSNSLQPRDYNLSGFSIHGDYPGQGTGMGSRSLLQGIFPTQGLNPGLPHCKWILYQLSHKGSPRILEWVANPFPGDLPDPGIELGSSALQADSLLTELSEKGNTAIKIRCCECGNGCVLLSCFSHV